MAHEILTYKLEELEDRLGKLHSRIHLSETAGHSRLIREIEALKLEDAQSELALRKKLQLSKSEYVSVLYTAYEQIRQLMRETETHIHVLAGQCTDSAAMTEAKLLLAEYALDFAHQAADRALLISMDAIDSQLLRQEQQEGEKVETL